MEFKRIQHKDSRQIIKWFVNGKEVNKLEYEYLEGLSIAAGKKYNSSNTTRRNSNCHFSHKHQYN